MRPSGPASDATGLKSGNNNKGSQPLFLRKTKQKQSWNLNLKRTAHVLFQIYV
jgi:hypothetical protein